MHPALYALHHLDLDHQDSGRGGGADDPHIHGYISRLPQGYDTVLRDNGTTISKGQKQDRILVMWDGQVVEQGTHDQLMAMDGFCKKLYQAQFDAVS